MTGEALCGELYHRTRRFWLLPSAFVGVATGLFLLLVIVFFVKKTAVFEKRAHQSAVFPPSPLDFDSTSSSTTRLPGQHHPHAEPLSEQVVVHLGADLSLPLLTVRRVQETLDCWLTPGGGGRGGGAWVDDTGANGWLYAVGSYLGAAGGISTTSMRWEPAHDCGADWLPWDPVRGAAILRRFGGAFFWGDSISEQQYSSLRSAFGEGSSEERGVGGRLHIAGILGGAASDLRAYFAWTTGAAWEGADGDPAKTVLAVGPFRLVVVNRGAHFVPDAELIPAINESLHSLRAEFPNVLVVWRATVPGVVDCASHAGEPPLTGAAAAEEALYLNERAWPYHWGEFRRQNDLVRDFLRRHHPHVLVLDAVAPTMLRPAARVGAHAGGDPDDCLHFAMPGPPDLWNVSLLELLALLLRASGEIALAA